MAELVLVIGRADIDAMVAAMARQISFDYQDSEPVLVGVLKGAFIFLADLVRRLTIPVEIDFIGVSSYGADTRSSGDIRLTKGLTIDIENKDVLVVEDMVDSGLTLAWLMNHLKAFNPNSVKVCVFVDKRERRRERVRIDYACHTVDNGFLVGYGLDYAEKYRNLPGIYHLKF